MTRRTRFGAAVGAALMAAALTAPAAAADNERVDIIVVYAEGVSNSSATTTAVARQYDAQPQHVYEHALEGFAGSVPEGRLNGLRHDPRVDYVELDQEVSIAAQALPTGVDRIFADDNANIDIDDTDDVRVDVDVAVIDTGIDLDHPDLNVAGSTNCLNHSGGPPFSRTYTCEGTGDDGNGHGTHVAGTIGAIDNGEGVVGAAPGARLYGVKVLDDSGSGTNGSVIAGIDWVRLNADTIEVANLSLGGGESTAVDDALTNAANAGVAIAVAAGNSSADVDDYGPAGHPQVLTVSALADFDGQPGGGASPTCRDDEDDTFANFSNYGDTAGDDVDVIAPGVCILSTWNDGGTNTISGTSMASPHVAGGLALLASGDGDPTSWSEVQAHYDTLLGAGNLDWEGSQDPDSTKEPLLDVGDETAFAPATTGTNDDGGDETNTAPSVTITSPTDGSTFDSGASITLEGSSNDNEDGDLSTSITWTSNIDGDLGSGSSITTTLTDGDHTIAASVTDGDGASGEDSITVTVGDAGDISLTASGYKVRGRHNVDLDWSGASGDNVDVHRDGSLLTTTANDGEYTDSTNNVGGGSYTYQVCEAGTSTCSSDVTVTF